MLPRNKPKRLVTDYFTPSLLVVSVKEGQLNLGSSWYLGRPFCEGLVEVSKIGTAKGSMNREMGRQLEKALTGRYHKGQRPLQQ
jgi:hypothetical protein